MTKSAARIFALILAASALITPAWAQTGLTPGQLRSSEHLCRSTGHGPQAALLPGRQLVSK